MYVSPPSVVEAALIPVHSNDCFASSSPYYSFQQFIYNPGRTTIRTTSTQPFCVDFGSTRFTNGVPLKIWQCYTNLPAQQLWITGDNHIAVEGDNQCADVRAESGPKQGTPYGSLKDVQSWQCAGGNPNQVSRRSVRVGEMLTRAPEDLWILTDRWPSIASRTITASRTMDNTCLNWIPYYTDKNKNSRSLVWRKPINQGL